MSRRLAGKRALVTGAAQGLGAAIAARFAAEGARVLLTDLNAAGAAEQAKAINRAVGTEMAFASRHDVTREADWKAALAEARAHLGGLSVLVNNAGIGTGGTIAETDLAGWRQAFAVNVEGAFLGCRMALDLLCESPPAAIVNIASAAAVAARADMAAYGASKAALCSLTKSVALYCAQSSQAIRCNALLPAFADTPILDNFAAGSAVARDKVVRGLARQVPLGRIAAADEVALGAVYLASDESAFMTGAELRLDGGLTAM